MRNLIFIFTFILAGACVAGQPYKNPGIVSLNSGYANVNELNAGYGIKVTSEDFSKYFVGFTTTHGYQLNLYGLNTDNNLFGGLGTGILFYNGGALFPLYGDMRFTWNRKKFSPFVYGRSGLLINPDDLDLGTRQFINAGGGVKIKMNEQFTFTVSPGILIQMGNIVPRDAFVDIKVGVTFKPK